MVVNNRSSNIIPMHRWSLTAVQWKLWSGESCVQLECWWLELGKKAWLKRTTSLPAGSGFNPVFRWGRCSHGKSGDIQINLGSQWVRKYLTTLPAWSTIPQAVRWDYHSAVGLKSLYSEWENILLSSKPAEVSLQMLLLSWKDIFKAK